MKGNSPTSSTSRSAFAERSRDAAAVRSIATALRRASLGLSISAATLGAQGGAAASTSGSRPTLSPPLALAQPALRERAAPSGGEVFGRIALASGGVILGGLGGGLLGYGVIPHSRCHCDDPGLREFVIGATAGLAVGAALAAAIPTQRSECSYGKRVLYGFAGAVAVGALGLLPPGDQRVVFVPLGAAVGAGVASAFCR